MAKDISDTLRDTFTQVIHDATQNGRGRRSSNGPLSGGRGVAAGAGLAAVAPLAAKGVGKIARRRLAGGAAKSAVKKPADALSGASSKLGDTIGKGVGDKVKEKVDESGGVAGVAKEAGKGMMPFGGSDGGGGGQGGAPGVGKGRRMPVQQSMDVAVPIETCYNQWTQYEEWPLFMHRVTRVTWDPDDDPATVSFATKIWAKTKEFTAKIETQRPDERIKWSVEEGITHTGVVTFHELAPNLTRVELSVDVDPGSLIEKAARGMRHIKRAMRADMHRFKAFIEMQELETGAWRGVIEDGEVVEDHDPSYDEERDYADANELRDQEEGEEDEDQPEAEEDDQPAAEEDQEEEQAERPKRQASSSRRRSSSKSSSSGSRNGGSASGKRSSARRSSGSRSSGNGSSSSRRKAPAKRS
jgi:uncharacterized membrane protein